MSVVPSIEETDLPGVLVVHPHRFGDARGYFVEVYNEETFSAATGLSVRFVQDNESQSAAGTVRGLHYQLPPRAQGKLVRAVEGSVFDVAVDLRRSSPRLGRWTGFVLSAEDHSQLWIPPGFGHGFMALTDTARIGYKTTDFYDQSADRCVRWNDPEIGIEWPTGDRDVILSDRDATAPGISEAELFD